jgi:hypothetical protein
LVSIVSVEVDAGIEVVADAAGAAGESAMDEDSVAVIGDRIILMPINDERYEKDKTIERR